MKINHPPKNDNKETKIKLYAIFKTLFGSCELTKQTKKKQNKKQI
jgi:hypothetical protein